MVSISLLIIVCLICTIMFNIQHKEHVQISHVSYIRKPRLSGTFLGNECVRINKVSLYKHIHAGIYVSFLHTTVSKD